jgi:CBS domain-containing protein
MRTELITVSPCTSSLEALELMREKKIGCLPVVREGKLVGVVTAYDFLTVGSKLFEEKLKSVMAAVSGPNGGPEDRAD